MTDQQIPIGPIVGAAVGLGMLAGAVKITRDLLDKEHEKAHQHKRYGYTEKYERTPRAEGDTINRGLDKMLYRR